MPRKTKVLPTVRLSEVLHDAVLAVAIAQDVSIGEVVRLALMDYCMPKLDQVTVPIVGELSANMNWDDLTTEFKKAKKEFQSQAEALALAIEGE